MPFNHQVIYNRIHQPLQTLLFQSRRKKAVYRRPRLVILCHGFKGDKKEKDRFLQAAAQLNQNGMDALCFDFSGSGENPREPILLSRQVCDLEDVARWAHLKGYTKIGTIGLSFGGLTALMATLPTRTAAVFWAPAFYPRQSMSWPEHWLARLMVLFPTLCIKLSCSGPYPPILVNYRFVREVLGLDPNAFLQRFHTPSLILQGEADTTVKPESTMAGFLQMPRESHHQYVPVYGAAHDFDGDDLVSFVQHTVGWFKRYL